MSTPEVINLRRGTQRLVVLLTLVALGAVICLWPLQGGSGERAVAAAAVTCNTTPGSFSGLVNGNALALGNGTTVTPCLSNAPIHMRIGYSDGGTGAATGSSTAFTTDGITFPDGKLSLAKTGCTAGITSGTTIAKPTILKFADGTQSAGPANRSYYGSTGFLSCGTASTQYAYHSWPTSFAQSDNSMLVHMRLKNLQINRNAFMTVVPQSDAANPTVAGTGEYKLTFTPHAQGSAGWNIGDSCVYTDLWLRADTHIKVNIFSINTTVGALAGDDSLWGSILSSIASADDIPGLELDGWVYYMNTNRGSDCTGTPTTLNLPNTDIQVTP